MPSAGWTDRSALVSLTASLSVAARHNKPLQRDASIASLSDISLKLRSDAARSARLNSGVSWLQFQSRSAHGVINLPPARST